jgi:hypothetical protein
MAETNTTKGKAAEPTEAEKATAAAAEAAAKVAEEQAKPSTPAPAQARSASDALKASQSDTLRTQAEQEAQAEAQRLAGSQENLNYGMVAPNPEPTESDSVVTVSGGTKECTVVVAAFSVIDKDGVHNSFTKGQRIKISDAQYKRGVSFGALR